MVFIDAVGIIVYGLLTLYLIRTRKEHLVFFGYYSFMVSWALVSCFYNDLGIYNLELSRYTETTFATARLAAFLIVFNLGFFVAARIVGRRPLARVDYTISRGSLRAGYFKIIVYAVIGLLITYIFYSFATEGIPVLSGLSRIDFFKQANPLERYLIIYAPLLAFLLGYYRRKRGMFSLHGVILAIFVMFAVAIGNKFSFLIILMVCYFAPIFARYIAANPQVKIFTRRRILGLTAIVAVLILFAFGTYIYAFKNVSYAYTILVNRVLAFQGQMWWAVDNDIARHGRYDSDHWVVELDNIFSPGDTGEGEVGMKYLMVQTLGPEKAYTIFDRGYLYTHTYPAILIATFPYAIAIIVEFFAGALFFVLLFYFYYSIVYGHAVRAVVTLLILMPYVSTLFSGNFATFLTPGIIIKALALIVMELGAHHLNRVPSIQPTCRPADHRIPFSACYSADRAAILACDSPLLHQRAFFDAESHRCSAVRRGNHQVAGPNDRRRNRSRPGCIRNPYSSGAIAPHGLKEYSHQVGGASVGTSLGAVHAPDIRSRRFSAQLVQYRPAVSAESNDGDS
jgi:hypothetical protein